MDYSRNPKVLGAFLIGFALVVGAYVVSNFGQPSSLTPSALYAVADEAPSRVFIPVTDNDGDGLEDWRDQFITAPAVSLDEIDEEDYLPPETLTGQLGVNLIEGFLTSIGAGPLGKSKEQVVADTVDRLEQLATSDKIYDVKDIIVTSTTNDEIIRSYGNALADILITQSDANLEDELFLLETYLNNIEPTPEDAEELIALATVYKNYRDRTLETPVPRQFIKEHLDLINVYNALYNNIETMTKASADPMLPYVRLQRYEDDIRGLSIAFTNIYNSLVPFARVFEANDSALVFVNFSSDYQ